MQLRAEAVESLELIESLRQDRLWGFWPISKLDVGAKEQAILWLKDNAGEVARVYWRDITLLMSDQWKLWEEGSAIRALLWKEYQHLELLKVTAMENPWKWLRMTKLVYRLRWDTDNPEEW